MYYELYILRTDNGSVQSVIDFFVPFSNIWGSHSWPLRLFTNSRLGSIVQFIKNLKY